VLRRLLNIARRDREPSNAVPVRGVAFVGDPVGERQQRSIDVADTLGLNPLYSRTIIWGEKSDPYSRAWRGDPGPVQAFKYAGISANPNIATGDRTALPGTSPPPGALNPVLDLLRRTQ
jgi:hypothetical protein